MSNQQITGTRRTRQLVVACLGAKQDMRRHHVIGSNTAHSHQSNPSLHSLTVSARSATKQKQWTGSGRSEQPAEIANVKLLGWSVSSTRSASKPGWKGMNRYMPAGDVSKPRPDTRVVILGMESLSSKRGVRPTETRSWPPRRRFMAKHPEQNSVDCNARRARKLAAEGTYTRQEWAALKRKYNRTCLACKRREPQITLTADHIIPLARGGSNTIDNIQPLCQPCNSRKHTGAIDLRPLKQTELLLE